MRRLALLLGLVVSGFGLGASRASAAKPVAQRPDDNRHPRAVAVDKVTPL